MVSPIFFSKLVVSVLSSSSVMYVFFYARISLVLSAYVLLAKSCAAIEALGSSCDRLSPAPTTSVIQVKREYFLSPPLCYCWLLLSEWVQLLFIVLEIFMECIQWNQVTLLYMKNIFQNSTQVLCGPDTIRKIKQSFKNYIYLYVRASHKLLIRL